MNTPPAAVVFRNVSKSFDQQPVLADVSLTIPGGCVVAVVGESGCGKSTLLEHINGLHRPDAGEVQVLGQAVDYKQLIRLRKKIGYAVQGVGLFPHLTARDNLELPARLSGWTSQQTRERGQRLMQLMELEAGLADRFPHQLSGGQQQRFSLCRAMMLEPPLLLLDEPFSALDPMTRHAIHREFLALQDSEHTTVVLVTHDLREARKLSQQLVIICDGRIAQSGATETVIAKPANDFVSRLLREQLQ